MAGYYDPNKDYSVAIEQAKAKGQDTTQLEQERANKIADKYGGNEPTMYGSDKTYSQLSGSNANWQNQSVVRDAVNTANAGANNSIQQQMEQAAQSGNWDLAGSLANQLATPDGYYGGYNMEYANSVLDELANKYNYNAQDYYNQLYDRAYGAGSSAVYDATGGAVKSYNDLVAMVGQNAAQKVAAQYGASMGSTPSAPAVANDMTKYLEALYTQNLEAELAALKNAYDSNVAELESQNDRIAEQYRAMRNQAAAQNALETQRMNEVALAQGLNTGTTGQMALAQNMAYQGNLGNLWAQEAQQQSEVDLALAQLMRDYNAGVNQTTASINAQRSEALYNEMIRQQELAQAQQKTARDYALAMLGNGIMPDAGTLSAAGISNNEAQLWYALTAPAVSAPIASAAASSPVGASYNNGGLTASQVKTLQEDINKYLPEGQKIAVDGVWGPATQAAAGGFTAKEYADEYYKQNSWSGRSDR